MQLTSEVFFEIVLVLLGFFLGMCVGLIFCKWIPSPSQREEKRIKKQIKKQKAKCRDEPIDAEIEEKPTKTLSEKIQDKPSYVNDVSLGNCSERVKKKRKEQSRAYKYLKGRTKKS